LISSFHYGFTRLGTENTGIQQAPTARLRDITDRYRNTVATIRNSPVYHFSEDLSWIKGAHTVAFGGGTRLIHNNRQSQATSFSDALASSAAFSTGAPSFWLPTPRTPRLTNGNSRIYWVF